MSESNKKRNLPYRPQRIKDIHLLDYTDLLRQNEDGRYWDPVRNMWLDAAPEEMVRLLLVHGLNHKFNVSFRRMATERGLKDKRKMRFDLVIFDSSGQPHLLIECKSPERPLMIEHFIQLGNYNESLNARFVMLTNGVNSVVIDLNSHEFIESLASCFPSNS
ncbi:MAG: type I restriction enzyme HsdR N-terminal domain-containing protein [Saprospiraceae bacterium]|nr:type I restriction enzyme HsdR N-terminal domain-containing protein [Saprospiraceae bacterium]